MGVSEAQPADFVVEILNERQQQAAMTLVAKNIPEVRRARIGHDGDEWMQACARFTTLAGRSWGRPVTLPGHLWLGIFEGNTLAAALHASVKSGEASEYIAAGMSGNPDAPSASWIERFLNKVTSVEEVAVRPEFRGRGLGQALLRALHQLCAARDDECVDRVGDDLEPTVVTFAGNAAAQALFASVGYTVGSPRTAIPRDFVADAKLLWDPLYNDRDGSYCYGHLSTLAQ